MNHFANRCDIAAEALLQVAQGADFAPQYTSEQAIKQASRMLAEAGERIRRADQHMFEQSNQIYGLEMALAESRKPWWRKMWEMVR